MQPGSNILIIGNGAEASGGTVTGTLPLQLGPASGSVLFNGVTLETDVVVNNGFTMRIDNDLTLNGTNVTLAATTDETRLQVNGSGSIFGNGEILFGGSATDNTLNWIRPFSFFSDLNIGSGITIRAESANGQIGYGNGTVFMDGSIVNERPSGNTTILGSVFRLNGNMTLGSDALIDVLANNSTVFAPGASIDIEIGNALLPSVVSCPMI